MQRILIIGNGYLASNLAASLSNKTDCDVTVYAKTKNVEYVNVKYIYNDIENISTCENMYDHIFILFGYSRPTITATLSDFIYTNVFLVSKVLEFAIKNNSKIFYPATSLILSSNTNKSNHYAYTHNLVVDLIKQYNNTTQLEYTICYLHNIYGNMTNINKKHKMVIDNFIDCYNNKLSVTLYNNGIQRRIFTHVTDVVNYMYKSMYLQHNNEINLVKNNNMYSVRELLDILKLQSTNIKNNLYSCEDPYILPIDTIQDWEETIDVKQWLQTQII